MRNRATPYGIGIFVIGFFANLVVEVFPMTGWEIPIIWARSIVIFSLLMMAAGVSLIVYESVKARSIIKKRNETIDEFNRRLIELREPHLPQIPNILRDMKEQLNNITESIIAKPSHNITKGMLEDISKHIYSKVGIPQTDNQTIEYFMRITWALDAHNIGFKEVLKSDIAWNNLISQLNDIVNPDGKLASLLERYLICLKGIDSDKLYGHYVDLVYGDEAERVEDDKFVRRVNALGARQYFDKYLNKLETDIGRRIEYLMSGGEAE